MSDVDKIIRIFVDFLNASWNIVDPLTSGREYSSDEASRNDWLQANWEILIERKILPLNSYLDVYGEGADFNGQSSRITDPACVSSHYISILVSKSVDLLNDQMIIDDRYILDEFVSFSGGFYKVCSPFKHVLIYDKQTRCERVFAISDVKFELVGIVV
jgi:hypothetical protein